MNNPLELLAKLKVRFLDEARKKGFIVPDFSILPNENPDGPHLVRTMLLADPEFAPETVVEDPEFDRVVREAEEAERDAKLAEARKNMESLRDTLSDPSKGLGFEDL